MSPSTSRCVCLCLVVLVVGGFAGVVMGFAGEMSCLACSWTLLLLLLLLCGTI